MSPLALYLVSILTFLSPIEQAVQRTHLPAAKESAEERLERYQGIASSLAEVLDEEKAPLIFAGSRGKARTGAFVLAVAYMESGFRRDVDLGIGKEARGGGLDSCLLQIRLGKGMTTDEGYTADDVMHDRAKCFRAGLRMMKRSLVYCRSKGLPVEESLAAYAGGNCSFPLARQRAKSRYAVYDRIVQKLSPPTAASLLPPVGGPLAEAE